MGIWGQLYFNTLSLLVRTCLNRKQKYHSEILLYFQGCRSFTRRRKGERLWLGHWCRDQKSLFQQQQAPPKRSFWARSHSHTFHCSYINASFQVSRPCWGIHSFLRQWRFQWSFGRAGSPSWFPFWPASGGVASFPNQTAVLVSNNSAPPQLSPYHETCGRTGVRHWHWKMAASLSPFPVLDSTR